MRIVENPLRKISRKNHAKIGFCPFLFNKGKRHRADEKRDDAEASASSESP
jgi:hypothetical protein